MGLLLQVTRRISNSSRNHTQKRQQILEDVKLMQSSCPNLQKLNMVMHYKQAVLEENDFGAWENLSLLSSLVELDLVTMRFVNVKGLLRAVGPRLEV